MRLHTFLVNAFVAGALAAAPVVSTDRAAAAPPPPPSSASMSTSGDVGTAAVRWVHIWADDVNVRACYRLHCEPVTQIDSGWYPYTCTIEGDRVTYGGYTNFYWTRLAVDVDGDGSYEEWGFVSDVFVSGGSDDHPAMPNPSWDCFN